MWSVKNSSALIDGKFIFYKTIQTISTNERVEFITDHMTYNTGLYLNFADDNHPKSPSVVELSL